MSQNVMCLNDGSHSNSSLMTMSQRQLYTRRCSMTGFRCNLITLAILGFFDLKTGMIPNAILLGWIGTHIVNLSFSATHISLFSIAMSLLVVGIFYPLRRIVRSSAGDFKLYAAMMLIIDPIDSLYICFITMLISLIPLASGIKMVPIALTTFFGYITFLLLRLGEII